MYSSHSVVNWLTESLSEFSTVSAESGKRSFKFLRAEAHSRLKPFVGAFAAHLLPSHFDEHVLQTTTPDSVQLCQERQQADAISVESPVRRNT